MRQPIMLASDEFKASQMYAVFIRRRNGTEFISSGMTGPAIFFRTNRQQPEDSSTAVSILDQGSFEFYTVSEHGITFKAETPQDVWLEVTQRLLSMHEGAVITKERTLMLLADTLNHGEKEWPHEFAQAIDGTRLALGLSPKTIANAQWVYGKIESSRRRDGLTLGHYSVIAALKDSSDQDAFIEQVIADPNHTLTVEELKSESGREVPQNQNAANLAPQKTLVVDLEKAKRDYITAAEKVAEFLTEQAKSIRGLKRILPFLRQLLFFAPIVAAF